MEIAQRRVAYIHYTLTNDAGVVLDSSRGAQPLAYLHGAGNIIAGLENALAGKQAGDKFTVRVEPAQAYGERDESLVQQVPRRAFAGISDIRPGMSFQAQSSRGPMRVVVTRVAGDMITVDGNHPLAGEALNFDVEVTEVREASAEELSHGHVHGPGGHQH
ncbi:FKBP-type peptidyl-prolyl cis-trans isomerase [Sinimarinibacterium thermocellulolyticum]|uniref:Peptidyl-prolyl cis-trans isomerase n=1 Tax=Sinimarinibacterium thermocellulolyticum TaxID=3170016 RepID=A0ABV2AE73_9GAMM